MRKLLLILFVSGFSLSQAQHQHEGNSDKNQLTAKCYSTEIYLSYAF